MAVTRCVCREVPFAVVARAAQSLRDAGHPISFQALADLTTAGTGCGTCKPYLARAALTGQTVLPVMGAAECTAWIARLEETPRSTHTESGNIPR